MGTVRVSSQQIDQTLRGVSTRLRGLRIERGLRLSDLAAMTGFSEAYLYRVEQGQRSPSLAALLRLAEAYDISPGELLVGPAEPARSVVHVGMATWDGTEREGLGRMWTNAWSESFTRASRIEPTGDFTTPEAHVGMALAGCFSMSLAKQLSAAGFAPARVETTAAVTLSLSSEGPTVRSIELVADADVPDVTPARLEEIAQHTRRTCVISRALAAVPTTLQVRQPSQA